MATRFYLPSTGTPPLAVLAKNSQWEQENGMERLPCFTTKQNTPLTNKVLIWASATTQQWCWFQFQSQPLQAAYTWTTADTVSMVLRGLEANSANNSHLAYCVRVVSGDGATQRGIIGFYGATSTEFTTSVLTRIHSARTNGAAAFSSQIGDRIIIEIGLHGVTPNISFTNTLRVGDPTASADFALTAGLTTDLCPWVELSRTVAVGDGPIDLVIPDMAQAQAIENITVTLPQTYYIAPTGSDTTGTGAIGSPWHTFNKAWPYLNPGDTLYMRGGTYEWASQQTLSGRNGTSENRIQVLNYPGELPSLTRTTTWSQGGASDPNERRAFVLFTGNYVNFRRFHITGISQDDTYQWQSFRVYDCNYNIFDFIEFHHNEGTVYLTGNSTGNIFLNCDFYENYDPLTYYYDCDGLNIEGTPLGTTNYVYGCRSWNNSDDAFDYYYAEGTIITENCWAWGHGYREDRSTIGGDGSGFKLGGSAGTSLIRRVNNCLSFKNASWGFSENEAVCNMEIFNNTSYQNNTGGSWGGGFHFNVAGVPYYIRNNVAFDEDTAADLDVLTNVSNNSWNGGVTLSAADFASLDDSGVAGARQADGSLPALQFLKLAAGSDLIDAGVDVGIAYSGAAPDLGAYEYSTAAIDLTIADLAQGQTIEAIIITQEHNIQVVALNQSQSIEGTVIIQEHNLVIGNISQDQSVENLTITQVHVILIQDIRQTQGLEAIAINQIHTVAIQDMNQGHSIEAPSITQVHTIAAIAALQQEQTIADIAVTQQHNVTIQNIAQAQAFESMVMDGVINVIIQDVAQSQAIEVIAVTQQHNIALQVLQQAQEIANIAITQVHQLQIDSQEQTQVLEDVTITQVYIVTIHHLFQAQGIDSISITQEHNILIDDLLTIQVIDSFTVVRIDIVILGTLVGQINRSVTGILYKSNQATGSLLYKELRGILKYHY